jgi:hypothetical protein
LGIASIVSCRAIYDEKPWVWQTGSMIVTTVTGIYVLAILLLLLGFMFCISEIYYRNQGNIAIRVKLNPMYSIYRHTSRGAIHYHTFFVLRRVMFMISILGFDDSPVG